MNWSVAVRGDSPPPAVPRGTEPSSPAEHYAGAIFQRLPPVSMVVALGAGSGESRSRPWRRGPGGCDDRSSRTCRGGAATWPNPALAAQLRRRGSRTTVPSGAVGRSGDRQGAAGRTRWSVFLGVEHPQLRFRREPRVAAAAVARARGPRRCHDPRNGPGEPKPNRCWPTTPARERRWRSTSTAGTGSRADGDFDG